MVLENNQITIPLDSSFVNAFVYIAFDLGIAAVFGITLGKLHGALTSRRLRNGMKVTLRESPIRAITGGILRDGSYVWWLLGLIQILMFATLFAATLGINGRTSKSAIPIQRDYITYLPKVDPSFRDKRQSPPIFSSCVVSDPPQLLYHPTAFNVVGTSSITHELLFEDQFGIAVQVNTSSSVCQDFEGVQPVLSVRRCGQSVDECSNLNISTGVLITLKNELNGVFPRSGHTKGYSLWRPLELPVGVLSNIGYTYIICNVRGVEPEAGQEQVNYLCAAGHFDIEEQLYTFRIGRLNFSAENIQTVLNTSVEAVATFTPHSVEAELKCNVFRSRGLFFASTLHQHSAKRYVAAKEFLDSIVNRLSAARKIDGDALQRRTDKQVTDVQLYSIVFYIMLIVVSVVLMAVTRTLRFQYGPSSAPGRINVDVTTYDGVLAQLHSASSHPDKKGLSFGVVCDEEHQKYQLRHVHEAQKLSPLPNGAVLQR